MAQGRLSRREFLDLVAGFGVVAAGGVLTPREAAARGLFALGQAGALAEIVRQAPVGRYWTSSAATAVDCTLCHDAAALGTTRSHRHSTPIVRCQLCAHGCVLRPGERGRCRVRIHVDGELRSLVYGRPLSAHVDPIEKKPFFHFLPGTAAYSFGTAGCPLRCRFCQNWEISQAEPESYRVAFTPAPALVERARSERAPVIAFTYNEATVFTEYLVDVARAARAAGLRAVLVSCGFMAEAPLTEMIEVLDAIKIDLKGFSPEFYRQVSSAELAPVLRSIRQIARAKRHLEIVNLVVPTLNDAPPMLTELAKWVAGEVGRDVPLHFTRFHPDYQLQNLPPTPIATLERAREIALAEGCRFAYVGNVPGHAGNNTFCPKCGRVVIARSSFFVTEVAMKDGACAACGTAIAGVWR